MRVNVVKRLSDILAKRFERSVIWTAHALVKVWKCQTSVEQACRMTELRNDVGFSGVDAEFGSKLAEQANAWLTTPVESRRFDSPFSPKQIPYATRMAIKYRKQVAQMMLREAPMAARDLLKDDPIALKALCF